MKPMKPMKTTKTMYVTDLDGTLLNTSDRISDYSLETINRLVDEGMVFTYATARSLVSATKVTKGLSTRIPVIAYNGCLVVRPDTGEILSSVTFTGGQRRRIIGLILQNHIHPLVYAYRDGKEKVSWQKGLENDGMNRYLSLRQGDPRLNPVASEAELYQGEIFYFTCIGEREELLPIYKELSGDPDYTCTLQQELYRPEYWCEVMPREATKARAIEKLKTLWGCDRVVSFGDAINDLPMFHVSDECYAVANAVPECQQAATGVIGGNDEDGVARWLEEHVL